MRLGSRHGRCEYNEMKKRVIQLRLKLPLSLPLPPCSRKEGFGRDGVPTLSDGSGRVTWLGSDFPSMDWIASVSRTIRFL